MKHYIPRWDDIGITKERYLELIHFCRQYPEWKREASRKMDIHGPNINGISHGRGFNDPVAASAARRASLLQKIQTVEECASQVNDGEWYAAIIQNVCMSKPYSNLDLAYLPTSDRNSFFRAKREFFIRLNEKKENSE